MTAAVHVAQPIEVRLPHLAARDRSYFLSGQGARPLLVRHGMSTPVKVQLPPTSPRDRYFSVVTQAATDSFSATHGFPPPRRTQLLLLSGEGTHS